MVHRRKKTREGHLDSVTVQKRKVVHHVVSPIIFFGTRQNIDSLEVTLPFFFFYFHPMEVLSAFIATQKSLLARTQSDVEKLRKLRGAALDDPDVFVTNMGQAVRCPTVFSKAGLLIGGK